MDFSFLPSQFPAFDPLLRVGMLILLATVLGEVIRRWLRLPRVLAYLLTGVAAGPTGLGFIGPLAFSDYRLIFELAIGMVLFEVGRRVDLSWLRRNPSLFATSVLEAGLAFALVFTVLRVLDFPPLLSAVAAGICMATSPAVVMAVTRDSQSQGQITERVYLLSALDTVYAVVTVSVLFTLLHKEYRDDWSLAILHPVYLIIASVLLGAVASGLTLLLVRYLGRRDDAQYTFLVVMVALTIALADALNLLVILAALCYGLSLRAFDRERRFVGLGFGRLELVLLVALFLFAGASLDWTLLPSAGIAALGVIAARFIGKSIAVWALAVPSGLAVRKASLLSIALVPMAGLAILLAEDTARLYPEFGSSLAGIVLSVVAILEILGPPALYFAITRAGEVEGER